MSIGSVTNATPSTVFPDVPATSMTVSREYLTDQNVYASGEVQSNDRVTTSRKRWAGVWKATEAQADTLRAFFQARSGAKESFYFYDVYSNKSAVHDPTGVALTGRYTVRFNSTWQEVCSVPRRDITLELVELA